MNNKKCLYCGEELKTIKGIHKEYRGETTIAINNTPIMFCSGCNAEYLSANIMTKIKKIINEILEKKLSYVDSNIIIDFNDFK